MSQHSLVHNLETPLPAPTLPEGLIGLEEQLPGRLDRKLGYFGRDRFVLFYYEPRGEEVVWKDSVTYGFGTGAWCTYTGCVTRLSEQHNVELLGDTRPPSHGLLLDREDNRAYLAPRDTAEQIVKRQQLHQP